MSQPIAQNATADVVDAALRAAWGGTLPEPVDALVDRAEVGKLSQNSYLSFTFTVAGGEERPYVRLASFEDGGALQARVAARWPAAQAWFDRWPGAHVKIELDGSDDLRLFFFQIEPGDAAKVPAGQLAVGGIVQLSEGGFLPYTLHKTPPVALVSGSVKAAVEAAAAAGAQGLWFVRWRDGVAVSAALSAEEPYTPETAAYIQALGTSPGLEGARSTLAENGLQVHPWGVEWFADGRVEITFWGLRDRPQESWVAPEIFAPGRVPSADGFVEGAVQFLATTEQEAGRALVRDALYPALITTLPKGTDPAAWFRGAWDALHDRMKSEHPLVRADAFKVVALSAQLCAWDIEAFHLALARYLQTHPDTEVPAEDVLPAAVRDLAPADLKARAEALRAAAIDAAGFLAGNPNTDRMQLPGFVPQADNLLDTLSRAISADFTGGLGRLHEWMTDYGAGAYDHDPSLADIENVDLEAAASHAAIEEALARGDD